MQDQFEDLNHIYKISVNKCLDFKNDPVHYFIEYLLPMNQSLDSRYSRVSR